MTITIIPNRPHVQFGVLFVPALPLCSGVLGSSLRWLHRLNGELRKDRAQVLALARMGWQKFNEVRFMCGHPASPTGEKSPLSFSTGCFFDTAGLNDARTGRTALSATGGSVTVTNATGGTR